MREARSTHDSQDTLEYSQEIKDISISRYDDSIIAFDKELDKLFAELQKLDLRKNTLIYIPPTMARNISIEVSPGTDIRFFRKSYIFR